MMHEQLANYFNFLALEGYKYCHDYHYIEETLTYREVQKYYIEHYNKLLPEPQPSIIQVIPTSWYEHFRQDIDNTIKQDGIQKGMLAWTNWERETKRLYEKSYSELVSIGEIASAEKVRELIVDVDEELVEADKMHLEVLTINFDLSVIVPDQKEKYKKYSKKLQEINYK